ncbi:unnamed protein product [Dovyalis caffra]|uniref:Uncharacterized protein n=1 Tax=Dovyalis caffra TaxID=77055 RepID=A0AAV1REY1_9ROSI|nr:unnamed protein product [Dovyalis caffra]
MDPPPPPPPPLPPPPPPPPSPPPSTVPLLGPGRHGGGCLDSWLAEEGGEIGANIKATGAD